MFEQGFYDQLGFGTGGYEHSLTFDPGQLRVPCTARAPYRLTLSGWEAVHAARLQRRRGHGSCNLSSAMITYSDIEWAGNRSGLGYRDGEDGEGWQGIGGDYVVTLGAESQAQPGADPALPDLSASVGALTRLWMGSCPATGLAISDALTGPEALLQQLDTILCLPPPKPDW